MVILAQATMNKTQMAAVTTTLMNSLLPENAACVEEEALDIMKIGTTTMTMIMIGIMIWMSVKVTIQSLMSMVILAPHSMNLTQIVAETMTPKNSLPPENAASAEAEALDTMTLETKISKVVKYARTTSLLLMSMETLAPHSMNLTQMVAETMTPKNSLPPENAASVEAEALDTMTLEISLGTCTSPMMRLMDMP